MVPRLPSRCGDQRAARGDEDHGDRERQVAHACAERRVALAELEVLGDDEEHAEHHGERGRDREAAEPEGAMAEQAGVEHGLGHAGLVADPAGQQHRGGDERTDGDALRPSPCRRLR